jgi:hypothetical protein
MCKPLFHAEIKNGSYHGLTEIVLASTDVIGRRAKKKKRRLVVAQRQQEVHDTDSTQEHLPISSLDGNGVNMNTSQAPSWLQRKREGT